MGKKHYTLSEVIDFVTNGEDSSNVDSDEEEDIVILPPVERAEAETDCDSDISDGENEGLAHNVPHRLPRHVPLAQKTLSIKILMKAIKLVMMNHTSNFLRDRNKTRKKLTLTVLMILLIKMNYQQNYPTP